MASVVQAVFRLIIEPIDGVQDGDRAAAANRLRDGITSRSDHR